MFSWKEICSLLNKTVTPTDDFLFTHISTDSRSGNNNEKTVFFALSGPNFNGADFIEKAVEQGVRYFVSEQDYRGNVSGIQVLLVPNVLQALQKLAASHRAKFALPVIAITGSNGKTVVKEWLYYLLSPDYYIAKSPKSYNSQVGVALSVLTLEQQHNLGIFEAGISTTNEMQALADMLQPEIAVLTNIYSAHDAGFENRAQKFSEKAKLYTSARLVIGEYETFEQFTTIDQHFYAWSFSNKSARVFIQKEVLEHTTRLEIQTNSKTFSLSLPFTDGASIQNAAHCITTMLALEIDFQTIANRISSLPQINMRLSIKNGVRNLQIIDDSYSADLQSLQIALDFLKNQSSALKKILVLSDFAESDAHTLTKIEQLLHQYDLAEIVTVGEWSREIKGTALRKHFETTADFLQDETLRSWSNASVLIKGARKFEFEKILKILEQQKHETVLEINLSALTHNLNHYKSKLKPGVKLMVMVKAFGYGNGGEEIARLLEFNKVDYLGVAFADEGVKLRQAGITVPIMVLNPESTAFDEIIQYQLEPEIYSFRALNAFAEATRKVGTTAYPVHVKIDTGMHRLGFAPDSVADLAQELTNVPEVEVRSVLSHLAASDDLNERSFTEQQIERFLKATEVLQKQLSKKFYRHILNTSGLINYPEAQFEMVRLGIGLYGLASSDEEQNQLETVGTLKSIISQIHELQAGETVGYNRRFKAKEKTSIATIPIGYADGIPRFWGNENGYVIIHEQPAPIVGSVCMDMLMVDVSAIACREGDAVIIFGKRPTVQEIAKAGSTISYEILTGISQRVKRIFFRE
ncbi:bifunctional UDP-N-acetylmuramoyl-tripeptide:D-alanyl-D-alanine ligase/alanine racemase [Flavobacterium sp.]|uniref:bifunctional UDP-N-acetylmuramoyl-tripeptide:D-alanyl-D-alanine ligase/alanine racemase n=1 Tax=Flavobacterium sp. TaxID=239 RepID=UPI00261A8BB1|nr:bifunctional UDP-N-acetylmuramoyl-tripeptide:D-alanyl-D-alanine ligase/alanine racemase [Flavobacterium sp.]